MREQVQLFQRLQNLIYLCIVTDDKRLCYINEKPPKGAYFDLDEKVSEVASE